MLKPRFFIPFYLLPGFLIGCSESATFQTDPFCPACIEKACANAVNDAEFQAHVQSLSEEDKAQMTALVEAVDGCFEHQTWMREIADKAYQSYGAALYDAARPMHKSTVLRAFSEVLTATDNKAAALDYLSENASHIKDADWAKTQIEGVFSLVEADDMFALAVKLANAEQLAQLAQTESTPNRDKALMYRWHDLPEDVRTRALGAWVSAAWAMQTSGSAQLPQYLVLDWQMRPFPDGVPPFVATMRVDSIKIQNSEAKRRDRMAKDAFKWPPMREPNAYHARVDLGPWLSSGDNYRISAEATLALWPEDAPQACLDGEETCDVTPVYSTQVAFSRAYRVFIGVETGAPHRVKADKDNVATTKAFTLDICSADTCLPLWKDGAKTKEQTAKLSVRQGNDFYIIANAAGADLPVASRLMARAGEGKAWREIATFYTYAPVTYALPMRADIDLGDLCDNLGTCKLELQVRPSLRMARRDPRMTSYWGTTLELGNVQFDMLNQTAKQLTK